MNKYFTWVIVIVVLGVLFFLGFNGKNKKGELLSSTLAQEENINVNNTNTEDLDPKEEVNITNIKEEKIMYATLKTNMGDIKIEFIPEQAPNTVTNFQTLAKDGFYNGIKFHRVIKGFMIQGGDPLTKDDSKASVWGTGGPGYKFEDEISQTNSNIIGSIAMANAGPDTNGSQFFINTANNNFLDTKHTVFGKVVSGMDVVTKIENTPTAPGDRPISPVIINSIVLE